MSQMNEPKISLFTAEEIKTNPLLSFVISHQNDSCPLSFTKTMTCELCRISIQLMSSEDVDKARKSGDFKVTETLFACPLKIMGIKDLLSMKKVIKSKNIKKEEPDE